jgi:hypothetical protein
VCRKSDVAGQATICGGCELLVGSFSKFGTKLGLLVVLDQARAVVPNEAWTGMGTLGTFVRNQLAETFRDESAESIAVRHIDPGAREGLWDARCPLWKGLLRCIHKEVQFWDGGSRSLPPLQKGEAAFLLGLGIDPKHLLLVYFHENGSFQYAINGNPRRSVKSEWPEGTAGRVCKTLWKSFQAIYTLLRHTVGFVSWALVDGEPEGEGQEQQKQKFKKLWKQLFDRAMTHGHSDFPVFWKVDFQLQGDDKAAVDETFKNVQTLIDALGIFDGKGECVGAVPGTVTALLDGLHNDGQGNGQLQGLGGDDPTQWEYTDEIQR